MALGKDLAIVLAWPQCWAKAPESFFEKFEKLGLFKSTYFRVGHAAIVLVNGINGQLEYFDFGRYSTGAKQGRVRSSRSDPKLEINIQAKFDAKGDLQNLNDVLSATKFKQNEMHGEGVMHVAVCREFNFHEAKLFAENLQDQGSLDYGALSFHKINCANFVQKVLLQGIKCRKTKLRLRFPLTLFFPTPIGNVEAINAPRNYLVTEPEIIDKKRVSQWGVVKQFFLSTVVNLTHKKLEVKAASHLKPPTRSPQIPLDAYWLGGQGEGTWLLLKVLKGQNNFYRIRGLSVNGHTEYDFVAKNNTKPFDAAKPYSFTPDCSRLGITIIQNSQKIKLTHHKDFEAFS